MCRFMKSNAMEASRQGDERIGSPVPPRATRSRSVPCARRVVPSGTADRDPFRPLPAPPSVPELDSDHSDRDLGAASRPRAEGRVRTVLDGDGVTWLVFERRVDGVSYLFFEASHAFRRVRIFPREWMRLDDDLLVRLSWTR